MSWSSAHSVCSCKAIDHETWQHLDCGVLRASRSGEVCMTCSHFCYAVGRQGQTVLVCPIHESLIPQGDHLSCKCHQWAMRRELEIGWCPEVA
ncbi:MAG: galactose oxidase [Prochlorococcus sp.]|nr:galactose oxidase [Prochlorococcus sp.]